MSMQNQKGAVIIVVITVVFSILALSAIALKVALNTSNVAAEKVSKQIMEHSANSAIMKAMNFSSPTVFNKYPNTEIGFCVKKGNQIIFDETNYTVVTRSSNPTSSKKGSGGACGISSPDNYDSSRGTVATYVTVRKTNETVATFTNNLMTSGSVYETYATSMMPPNTTSTTQNAVNNCLNTYMSNPLSTTQDSIATCLDKANIPNVVRSSKYVVS